MQTKLTGLEALSVWSACKAPAQALWAWDGLAQAQRAWDGQALWAWAGLAKPSGPGTPPRNLR
eukprot:NODE_3425_length_930_cov_7.651532_g2853_i0.p4 GENE.NODE_3425_length_930_cov_7.651532_g2853_i0~~NODE_3425_length_930_cov_7.651532_g2853_i0.p4  ORF type:complete len:63 (+),score=14.39 NODE_3425_length_930_cov_7.651532_g2853_i0:373-561(+)